MKALQKYLMLALLAGMVLAGCRDDDDEQSECPTACDDPSNPQCPNYDPCLEKAPITANFKIYDDVFTSGVNSDLWIEDDILYIGRVKFEAVESDASYKWYLGQETIEGTAYQEVIKTIFNLSPGTYTAALRVEKEPDLQCFPSDTGVDSTFRTFQVVDVCDLMIMNKFKGVFETAPEDSVVLEFFPYKLLSGNQDWEVACEDISGIGYVNFSGNNDTIRDNSLISVGLLNRYFSRPIAVGDPFLPKGFFKVDIDGTCNAEYEINGQQKIFTGIILHQ